LTISGAGNTNVMTMTDYGFRAHIGVREFPPFIRVTLKGSARKELFSRATKKVEKIKKEYNTTDDIFDALYGEKKGKILKLLLENPQPTKKLIAASGLSPGAVYHFLKDLGKRHTLSKKGCTYSLEEYDFHSLFLDEIVKLEADPSLRRKYGASIKELELAYFLWDTFSEISPDERKYGRTYSSRYTLADAVHRWRMGRTDIPAWALTKVAELSESDVLQHESITQYHVPPGIPVTPFYEGEYNLPVTVTSDLDKIVMQLLHKISKNSLYTFPKKKKWLFEKLHTIFGEFDDSTSRIPSAIIDILKSYYRIKTFERSSMCFPPRMKARWSELNPLVRIAEQSSLLLHVISLSSRSSDGFEITSRSQSFLQDIATFTFGTGLGVLNLRKKRGRPHFRVYLSESKVDVLRRYSRLFQEYPDLEIWLRIPLNQIAEKLMLTDVTCVERICREELSLFIESILKSLERRKSHHERVDYLKYKEEITDYFFEQKLIPSPRRVEELVGLQTDEEEYLLYI